MHDFIFDLVKNSSGNANTSRVSQTLNTGSYVYTITIDTIVLVKNIAQIDTNPKFHTPVIGQFSIFNFQLLLNFNGPVDSIQGTAELSKNVITGAIHHPPMVLLDQLRNNFPVCGYSVDGGFIILTHQFTVTFDIGA
jgi:hypothetical protein